MASHNPNSQNEPGAELEAAARAQDRQEKDIAKAAQAAAPIPIFRASTEDEGEIVRGLLQSEGIDAIFGSVPTSAYGATLVGGQGYWSDVLVAPEDAERARALITAYQQGTPEDSPGTQ